MNPMDIFKNLQNLQSKMEDTQEKMKALRAEGSSGGGLVKVLIDGNMETLAVTIDPVAVDSRDITMLEELIAAAFTDATRKVRTLIHQEMASIANSDIVPDILKGDQN